MKARDLLGFDLMMASLDPKECDPGLVRAAYDATPLPKVLCGHLQIGNADQIAALRKYEAALTEFLDELGEDGEPGAERVFEVEISGTCSAIVEVAARSEEDALELARDERPYSGEWDVDVEHYDVVSRSKADSS